MHLPTLDIRCSIFCLFCFVFLETYTVKFTCGKSKQSVLF